MAVQVSPFGTGIEGRIAFRISDNRGPRPGWYNAGDFVISKADIPQLIEELWQWIEFPKQEEG